MCMHDSTLAFQPLLSASQSADLRLAASQLSGPKRRAFDGEMAVNHCGGTPWRAHTLFGWGRQTVAWGLAEPRTGSLCLGAQAAFRGRKRWEERHPQVAAALRQLAEAAAQQDRTCRTRFSSTRLTAQAAGKALREQGDSAEQLPAPSTMAEGVTRMGFRLRQVVKAKPHKKLQETDAIFDNRNKRYSSRVIRQRQTLESGLGGDGAHRRMFTRWSHPGRPPSPGSRYGRQGDVWPLGDRR